ncbi:MAG TPA: hypothetical protein VHI71_10335 [Actinomycetota bacterium]|nr:hypothetical protein [Actinomycetota bacterium]
MNDVERELRDLGERAAREVSYGEVPARKIVRRARVRRGVTVALPVLAAILLAAVAYPGIARLTRDGPNGREANLAFTTAATEAAGSARVRVEFEMTIDGRAITSRATGALDFERVRSHLVAEQSGGPSGSGRVELITIGDRAFQRMLDGPDGDESKWFVLDVPGGATAFAGGVGPADFLAAVESMAEDVIEVGEEELDGVRVTHYEAVIDPAAFGSFASAEIEAEPMHVWVDEVGRLRKLTFGSTIPGDGSMRMTMVLWDFGTPVHVAAPDPEDVRDDLKNLEPHTSESGSTAIDPSFDDFSADTQLVFGDGYLAKPFVTVNIDDTGVALLCVQAMPARAAGGTLLHEATGRRIATFGLHESGKKVPVACAPPGIAHEDVDALLAEPSDYTLRIEVERGRDVVVPLADTGSPLDDGSEE